jgi:hypothetical protein
MTQLTSSGGVWNFHRGMMPLGAHPFISDISEGTCIPCWVHVQHSSSQGVFRVLLTAFM